MQLVNPSCSRVLLVAILAVLCPDIETKSSINLTPTRSNSVFLSCVTKFEKPGKCVHWTYCNKDYEIVKEGIIEDIELRSSECTQKEDFCCSDQDVIQPPPPKQKTTGSSGCKVSTEPVCPWCVKLYRNGKDRRRLRSGLFCLGALVGTRVILTTATCVVQARRQQMWAHIASSPDPSTNYTVKFRLVHPAYNSGTRENDIALLTIDPEPNWGENNSNGACLGMEPNSLQNECVAAGIDNDENIIMTPLTVSQGNCGRGSSSDASCGQATGENCSVFVGSPVMCRPNNGPYIVTGVARLPCIDDPPKALLNNLAQASSWISDHLKGTMGLTETDYLKLNA